MGRPRHVLGQPMDASAVKNSFGKSPERSSSQHNKLWIVDSECVGEQVAKHANAGGISVNWMGLMYMVEGEPYTVELHRNSHVASNAMSS